MGIQPVVKLRLGNVVSLNEGFLPVCIGCVFSEDTNTGGFYHVRVYAVVVDQFDESRVEDK